MGSKSILLLICAIKDRCSVLSGKPGYMVNPDSFCTEGFIELVEIQKGSEATVVLAHLLRYYLFGLIDQFCRQLPLIELVLE
jgi:hypothetical protein